MWADERIFQLCKKVGEFRPADHEECFDKYDFLIFLVFLVCACVRACVRACARARELACDCMRVCAPITPPHYTENMNEFFGFRRKADELETLV